jgi:aryl-alcohol dehydrogenase-like predicted oxidoreductase
MSNPSDTFTLGDRTVSRLGYGAMRLAGPVAFGPPKDHGAALAVLREAVVRGVNHIDTSDYYGPHVTNRLIREALAPYPDDLVIVTKIGARRGEDASWLPAFSSEALTQAVHDNLAPGLDVLEVVNLASCSTRTVPLKDRSRRRSPPWPEPPAAGPGASHRAEQRDPRAQIEQARRITPIVCVQNHYNLCIGPTMP